MTTALCGYDFPNQYTARCQQTLIVAEVRPWMGEAFCLVGSSDCHEINTWFKVKEVLGSLYPDDKSVAVYVPQKEWHSYHPIHYIARAIHAANTY